jgi:hypothetical protein
VSVFDRFAVSLQATIEYLQPHITSKFVVGLESSIPVEAQACVGWNGLVLGGKAFLDVRSSRVSGYNLACAYQGPGFVATGHASEKFGKIVGTYWQKIDVLSSIAAEVVHEPSSNDVGLTMGYQHIEPDGVSFPACLSVCMIVCFVIRSVSLQCISTFRHPLATKPDVLKQQLRNTQHPIFCSGNSSQLLELGFPQVL